MNVSLWRWSGSEERETMDDAEPVTPVKTKRRGGRRKKASGPERAADTGELDLAALLPALADGEAMDGAPGEAALADEAPDEGWRIPPARPYLDPAWAPEPMAPGGADGADADADLPWWLALNRVKGIGPVRFRLLLDAFGSARGAWEASPAAWRAAGLDERTAATFGRQRAGVIPEGEMEKLARLRVAALRVVDAAYPRLLKEIPAPPPVIYVRGLLLPEDELALAIVGTRRISAYGRVVTERLAGDLAAQRVTIVSGLAALI